MSNLIKRLAATVAVAITTLVVGATAAQADLAFEPGSVATFGSTQAGAHADFHSRFSFVKDSTGEPTGTARTILTDLPPGFLGNPTATPTCTAAQVANPFGPKGACPANTLVGETSVILGAGFANGEVFELEHLLVYSVEPYADEPAAMMFNIFGLNIRIETTVRNDNGQYNIEAVAKNLNEGQPLIASDLTVWGVPADHQGPGPLTSFLGIPYGGPLPGGTRTPFLTNPSTCDGQPLLTTYSAIPWLSQSSATLPVTAESPAQTGCEKEAFDAGAEVRPASREAAAASGYDLALTVPQSENPDGVATPPVKDVSITLPQGTAISPTAAEGLGACSDAEVALKSDAPEQCPSSSKIGSVNLDTPLLDKPLTGSVYLGTQLSDNPQSGKMYRLFLVVSGSGVRIKLEGSAKVDPATGQITTSFDDNPQLPFERLEVHLKGGTQAPLVTPSKCGTYTTEATLAGWADPQNPVSSDSSFTIDQNCDAKDQFTPGFSAGTTNPIGGAYSPFTLRVTRPDGQQNVSTIAATLPQGVLAKLAGVPLCGDSDAATGSCPAASQVGSATVGAGAGSNALYVPQPGRAPTAVYLAGPYKGAPYSLVAKVPAQAGPFDLGTVAVRNTINIDPVTAQVSVKSDPLPQILAGIPIAYRDIRVDVNRDQFTLNPTSCDPMEVKGTIGSAGGKSANVSDRFQVANCERLGFKPSLKLSVKGPTHRNAHPAFKAVLTMPSQGANIQKAQVTLPKTELLENAHIRTICTRVQYAAGAGGGSQCPLASIYGKARAWSPLLDKPLEGPVYLRSSSHQLPDLVASLGGQIHIDLVGRIDAVNARIRNTFEGVPDAPVSRFVLEMQGGRKGLLANNTELCRTTPRAAVRFDGQNGKLADSDPVMKAQCGKARKGAKKHSAKH